MPGPAPLTKIVILDDYEQALRRLADWSEIDPLARIVHSTTQVRGEALITLLAEVEVLVLMRDRTPLTAELIDRLPRLRYVVFTGTRNNAVDFSALTARGIPVSHTAWGPSKDSTAELTWTLILAASKGLTGVSTMMRAGGWRDGGSLPTVLRGARLGVIGLGEVGSRVAAIGRAFGMEVVCWSPHMTDARAEERSVIAVSLEELLATARVVSLHLVAGPATRRLLNGERLASMRQDALLVNTSRASLIDTGALLAALAQGRPAQAALDVFDEEPLPAEHPLRKLPNVLLTPHLGFVAEPVLERFANGVVECLLAWLREEPLVRVLPPS
jgi:phosphoglycerate dehydrogenase-like enzyme